jgi:hypothetical protein
MQVRGKKHYRVNPASRRAWESTQVPVRFRLPQGLAEQIQTRAQAELMSLSGWIRQLCLTELRRKKIAA